MQGDFEAIQGRFLVMGQTNMKDRVPSVLNRAPAIKKTGPSSQIIPPFLFRKIYCCPFNYAEHLIAIEIVFAGKLNKIIVENSINE